MAVPAPLPDTERVVDWDELPERVRAIPANFNPLAQGVLMAQQTAWLQMQRDLDIAVCEKGRRTGITFAQALDDTITAATEKEGGGGFNAMQEIATGALRKIAPIANPHAGMQAVPLEKVVTGLDLQRLLQLHRACLPLASADTVI